MDAWAKFDSETGAAHLLAHHCADVAAVFDALVRSSLVRKRLETAANRNLSQVDWSRLAVLCFLHDIGKLHPEFQAKAWANPGRKFPRCSHSYAGCSIFFENIPRGMRETLGRQELMSWGEDGELLLAVFAHHGRPLQCYPIGTFASDRWRAIEVPQGIYDPVKAAERLAACMRCWFTDAFLPVESRLPTNPEFVHLFSGVVALADWIGSDRKVFEYSGAVDPGYFDVARKRAQEIVQRLRLDARTLRGQEQPEKDFAAVTGFAKPNAQQMLVGSVADTEQLVILEAETGGGKTEAALWRFVQLAMAGRVDSLYFALPTRAAALQIHSRIQKMLDRTWGEDAPEAVLAVPGYLRAGESEGVALPNWKVLWSDADSVSEQELAARWAAESARRYLVATVAVGTVDQAMLGALQVKHAHLRSAALSRSLLVLDEVHASDTYMTRIQDELLKTHLARGGYAMLMSATLGSCARERWLRRPQSTCAASVDVPYPAVWTLGSQAPMFCSEASRDKCVEIRSLPSMAPDRVAGEAVRAARDGARVLVVRNTVRAAVECWEAIHTVGGEEYLFTAAGKPALHHGRFASEDRKLLDRAVEDTLGRGRMRNGARIVVGTQTLEQSLDIDADWLITDLCPIDVLLQRIGRLHRHTETPRKPAFRKPVCYVCLPERGLESLLLNVVENGLGGKSVRGQWFGIYPGLAILEGTRRLISENPEWRLPSMNRFLVESATHPDCIDSLLAELSPAWREYQNKLDGVQIAEGGMASRILLDVTVPFMDTHFPTEDEEKIRTRLGEEGARVEFVEPAMGPFGLQVDGIVLPTHWSYGLYTTDPVHVEREGEKLRIPVCDRVFYYDRRGITKGAR